MTIELTIWQLIGIIVGTMIVSGVASLFLLGCLTAAKQADELAQRHWMEVE